MNTVALQVERVTHGYIKMTSIARELGISPITYKARETGKAKFSLDDIMKLTELLDLTLEKVNIIFFDGKLPSCNQAMSEKKFS